MLCKMCIQDIRKSVSDVEGYAYLLTKYNAVAPCTSTLHSFVLQDYDSTVARLKVCLFLVTVH